MENIKIELAEANDKIEKEQAKPITNLDMKRYFGTEDHLIKYSDLADYKDIFELLPTDRSYKIILIEQQKDNGHFVCICRYGKTICSFDPYGCRIDDELKFVNRFMSKMLGQDRHYLTDLLRAVDQKKWDIVYNKKKLQKLNNSIATCGKWCILWITFMKDFFYTLEDFLKFIKDRRIETGLTGDELVSVWIKN